MAIVVFAGWASAMLCVYRNVRDGSQDTHCAIATWSINIPPEMYATVDTVLDRF